MEGLVLLIIASLVGVLFNSKKKNDRHHDAMPPFNNKPPAWMQESPQEKKEGSRSLEDFAKGVFQQLNEKSTNSAEAPASPKKVLEREVAAKLSNGRPSFDENRSSDRMSGTARLKTQVDPIERGEIGSFIPTNRYELVHAVITSEILGPPKAKRK